MSRQRYRGILDTEIIGTMRGLVYRIVVIEGRYCKCGDVEGPMHMNEMATAKRASVWMRKPSSSGVLVSMLAMAVGHGVERDLEIEIQRVGA